MPEFEITSPEFPMWATTAASPWNFALVIDATVALDKQVRVNPANPTADPWSQPPISLSVAARRVPGWNLVRPKEDDADWFKTPPLPSTKADLGPDEQVTLVPLGSTHLRLTVFPSCSPSDRKDKD